MLEQSRQFGDVVRARVGDVSGEEEGELGSGGDQGVELQEDLVEPPGQASGDPALVAMGRETCSIPRHVLAGSAEAARERGEQLFEIGGRNATDQGGDGGGSRDPSEPESMGELGERAEGGMDLVIRPSLEGSQEEKAHDIARVGRRTAGGTRRAYRERRRQRPNEVGETAKEIRPSMPQEASVTSPIDSAMPSGRRGFDSVRC